MKRTLATLLSILYFCANTLLVHSAESNFWRDRKHANPQMAALPMAATPAAASSAELLRQIPALNKTLGGPFPTPKNHSSIKNQLPDWARTTVDAIPANAAVIKEVNVAPQSNRLIVLLQDVHMNQEAQRNIVSVLESLRDRALLNLSVEGASGKFDFSEFEKFPDKDIQQKVADSYLENNWISAPSHLGATSAAGATSIVGVDDAQHYRANVEAYRSGSLLKKKVSDQIELENRALVGEKIKVLNPDLRQFDARLDAYQSGNISFGDHVDYLSRILNGESAELVVEQFFAAYQIEKKLDFGEIERQRSRVFEKLTATVPEKDLKALLTLSLNYRAGNISYADYYQSVKQLIERAGIGLAGYPAFDQYIRYVLLSDGINAEKLFAAVSAMEKAALNKFCRTDEERELMARSRSLTLKKKLLDFALTPEEWKEYSSFRQSSGRDLSSFESFYREADIRSERMVENLLSQTRGLRSQTLNSNLNVLLVGGFHTPEITALLRKRGISYAVVQPKITKIEGAANEYLSIFNQEKSPLEQLFEGRKLFLAPEQLLMGRPTDGVDWVKMGMINTERRLAANKTGTYLNMFPSWEQIKEMFSKLVMKNFRRHQPAPSTERAMLDTAIDAAKQNADPDLNQLKLLEAVQKESKTDRELLSVQTLSNDELLTNVKEDSLDVFVIVDGQVGKSPQEPLGPGTLVGEMSHLANGKRSYNLKVLSPQVTVLKIPGDKFQRLISDKKSDAAQAFYRLVESRKNYRLYGSDERLLEIIQALRIGGYFQFLPDRPISPQTARDRQVEEVYQKLFTFLRESIRGRNGFVSIGIGEEVNPDESPRMRIILTGKAQLVSIPDIFKDKFFSEIDGPEYTRGAMFGGRQVAYGLKRNYIYKAVTPVQAIEFDENDYADIITITAPLLSDQEANRILLTDEEVRGLVKLGSLRSLGDPQKGLYAVKELSQEWKDRLNGSSFVMKSPDGWQAFEHPFEINIRNANQNLELYRNDPKFQEFVARFRLSEAEMDALARSTSLISQKKLTGTVLPPGLYLLKKDNAESEVLDSPGVDHNEFSLQQGWSLYKVDVEGYRRQVQNSASYNIRELIYQMRAANLEISPEQATEIEALLSESEAALAEAQAFAEPRKFTNLSFANRLDLFQLTHDWVQRMKFTTGSQVEPINLPVLAATLLEFLKRHKADKYLPDESGLRKISTIPVDDKTPGVVNDAFAKARTDQEDGAVDIASLKNYRDSKYLALTVRAARWARRIAKSLIDLPFRTRDTKVAGIVPGAYVVPTFENFDKDFMLIPDVHENVHGLRQMLEAKGWIYPDGKLRTDVNVGRMLIQLGDNINRNLSANGLAVLQLWVRLIQEAEEFNRETEDASRRISINLLLGNHELDLLRYDSQYLDNYYTTPESRSLAAEARDILQDLVRKKVLKGALYLGDPALAGNKGSGALLVHAGILPSVMEKIFGKINKTNATAVDVAEFINDQLVKAVGEENPSGYTQATFNDELFAKSPGRSKNGSVGDETLSGPFEAEHSPREKGDLFEDLVRQGILDEKGKKLLTDDQIAAKLHDIYHGILMWVGHSFFDGDTLGIRPAHTNGLVVPNVLILDGGDGQVGGEFTENRQTALVRENGQLHQVFLETGKREGVSSFADRLDMEQKLKNGEDLPPRAVKALDQTASRWTRDVRMPGAVESARIADRVAIFDRALNGAERKVHLRNIGILANITNEISLSRGDEVDTERFVVFALEGKYSIGEPEAGNPITGRHVTVTSNKVRFLRARREDFDEALENNDGFRNFIQTKFPTLIINQATVTTAPRTLTSLRTLAIGRALGIPDGVTRLTLALFEVPFFIAAMFRKTWMKKFIQAHFPRPIDPESDEYISVRAGIIRTNVFAFLALMIGVAINLNFDSNWIDALRVFTIYFLGAHAAYHFGENSWRMSPLGKGRPTLTMAAQEEALRVQLEQIIIQLQNNPDEVAGHGEKIIWLSDQTPEQAAALAAFKQWATDVRGVKLLGGENVDSQVILLLMEILRLLPLEKLNKNSDLLNNLIKGIDVSAIREQLAGSRTTFSQTEVVQILLLALAHMSEKRHLVGPLANLFHELRYDIYALPAIGANRTQRRATIAPSDSEGAPSKLFAETFMHYVLHGDLFSNGFPGYVNDTAKWQKIYLYYRDVVFKGVEFRDGRRAKPKTAMASASKDGWVLPMAQSGLWVEDPGFVPVDIHDLRSNDALAASAMTSTRKGAGQVEDRRFIDKDRKLALVTDGISTSLGGGDASGAAAAAIASRFLAGVGSVRCVGDMLALAKNAFQFGHAAAVRIGILNGGQKAGTTAHAVFGFTVRAEDGSLMKKAVIASVGDGQVLLLKKSGEIRRLTVEDSFKGMLQRQGLSAEEVKGATLLKYLGQPDLLWEEHNFRIVDLDEGDVILGMSDGISGNLSDQEIADFVKSNPSAADHVKTIVDASKRRGLVHRAIRSLPGHNDDMALVSLVVDEGFGNAVVVNDDGAATKNLALPLIHIDQERKTVRIFTTNASIKVVGNELVFILDGESAFLRSSSETNPAIENPGESHDLSGDVTVGRNAGSSINIYDQAVSRKHLVLKKEPGSGIVRMIDASKYGTNVSGNKLDNKVFSAPTRASESGDDQATNEITLTSLRTLMIGRAFGIPDGVTRLTLALFEVPFFIAAMFRKTWMKKFIQAHFPHPIDLGSAEYLSVRAGIIRTNVIAFLALLIGAAINLNFDSSWIDAVRVFVIYFLGGHAAYHFGENAWRMSPLGNGRPTLTTVPTNDFDALMAACRAAPRDDAPFLVLMDWIDEHGAPMDLLQVAIEMAQGRSIAAFNRILFTWGNWLLTKDETLYKSGDTEAMDLSKDGRWLAVSRSNYLSVIPRWQMDQGRYFGVNFQALARIMQISIRPDGNRMVVRDQDGDAEIFDLTISHQQGSRFLRGARLDDFRRVRNIQYSADGRWLVVAHEWHVPPLRTYPIQYVISFVSQQTNEVENVGGTEFHLSPDGKSVMVQSSAGMALYDLSGKSPVGAVFSTNDNIGRFYRPDSKQFVVLSRYGFRGTLATFYDLKGNRLSSIDLGEGYFSGGQFAFSPDSSRIAYAVHSGEYHVQIRDLTSSEPDLNLTLPDGMTPWQIAFQPDGQSVAVTMSHSRENRKVRIYDIANKDIVGGELPTAGSHAMRKMIFSPDNQELLLHWEDGVQRFRITNGKIDATLTTPATLRRIDPIVRNIPRAFGLRSVVRAFLIVLLESPRFYFWTGSFIDEHFEARASTYETARAKMYSRIWFVRAMSLVVAPPFVLAIVSLMNPDASVAFKIMVAALSIVSGNFLAHLPFINFETDLAQTKMLEEKLMLLRPEQVKEKWMLTELRTIGDRDNIDAATLGRLIEIISPEARPVGLANASNQRAFDKLRAKLDAGNGNEKLTRRDLAGILPAMLILQKSENAAVKVDGAIADASEKEKNMVLNLRVSGAKSLAEVDRELKSAERTLHGPVIIALDPKLYAAYKDKSEHETNGIYFVPNDERLDLSSSGLAALTHTQTFGLFNVIVSRNARLSYEHIAALEQLRASGTRVNVYVLLDEILRTAIPVSLDELSEMGKLQRLIATQA